MHGSAAWPGEHQSSSKGLPRPRHRKAAAAQSSRAPASTSGPASTAANAAAAAPAGRQAVRAGAMLRTVQHSWLAAAPARWLSGTAANCTPGRQGSPGAQTPGVQAPGRLRQRPHACMPCHVASAGMPRCARPRGAGSRATAPAAVQRIAHARGATLWVLSPGSAEQQACSDRDTHRGCTEIGPAPPPTASI
jgi:hypothetical protein